MKTLPRSGGRDGHWSRGRGFTKRTRISAARRPETAGKSRISRQPRRFPGNAARSLSTMAVFRENGEHSGGSGRHFPGMHRSRGVRVAVFRGNAQFHGDKAPFSKGIRRAAPLSTCTPPENAGCFPSRSTFLAKKVVRDGVSPVPANGEVANGVEAFLQEGNADQKPDLQASPRRRRSTKSSRR